MGNLHHKFKVQRSLQLLIEFQPDDFESEDFECQSNCQSKLSVLRASEAQILRFIERGKNRFIGKTKNRAESISTYSGINTYRNTRRYRYMRRRRRFS